jgi:hypothetical protein
LIISGIELNPGPIENRTFTDLSITSVSSIHKYMKTNVSFLHLNVQSLKPKLDLISPEYGDFDIQWNLSNPTHQGTREMCRIGQDVGKLRFYFYITEICRNLTREELLQA